MVFLCFHCRPMVADVIFPRKKRYVMVECPLTELRHYLCVDVKFLTTCGHI